MPSSYSILEIEVIGTVMSKKLKAAGIRRTDKFLARAKTAAGRKKLAEICGVPPTTILNWANMAQLMCIKGVAKEYCELLSAAGVTTVGELKHRNPANLAKALADANKNSHVVRFLPSEKIISRWIAHAKTLPPSVTY